MKAVIQKRYGSIDDLELREIDRPTAGQGEVLVRVHATSVHADVWHVVTGRTLPGFSGTLSIGIGMKRK